MRIIVIVVLALLLGYGLLQIDQIDPNNYVKMYIGGYMVEVKVLGFLLLLIAIVVLLYIALRLFRLVWRSPTSISNWNLKRNQKQSQTQFGAGYLSLIKGDWHRAEAQLTKKTQFSAVPYVNYLAAAQAAQEQGRTQQRDDYIKLAYDVAPKEQLAIGLVKARLHQSAGQVDEALSVLQELSVQGRNNPQYTAMLLQTYQQRRDWEKVTELLPAARKQQALSSESIQALADQCTLKRLQLADNKRQVWNLLDRGAKKSAKNIVVYADYLISEGESDAAEKLIRNALKSQWSDELIAVYGKLKSAKPAKMLRNVEGWLLAQPKNPAALLAAAKFAIADKQTDLAKKYLQGVIVQAPSAEAYQLLGKLHEDNNETAKALDLYRSGMDVAAGNKVFSLSSGVASETPSDEEDTENAEAQEGELIAKPGQ